MRFKTKKVKLHAMCRATIKSYQYPNLIDLSSMDFEIREEKLPNTVKCLGDSPPLIKPDVPRASCRAVLLFKRTKKHHKTLRNQLHLLA
jgi:hypothetical protein